MGRRMADRARLRVGIWMLGSHGIIVREILTTEAIVEIAGFVEKGAVAVVALFAAQEGRAVFGSAVLGPKQ